MTSWPWVGAALATKTLHKERPRLIPMLDNRAIFGACMNPRWPAERSLMDTIKSTACIREALEWIALQMKHSRRERTGQIAPRRARVRVPLAP